jgi:hypothetical protein
MMTRTMGMMLFLLFGVVVLGTVEGASAATIMFSDDFEYGGGSVLNWTPPSPPWDVFNGTIDYILNGNFGLSAASGAGQLAGGSNFVDLDGSSSNAGELWTNVLGGVLTPGQEYTLSFILSGSQRGTTETVEVGFGTNAPLFNLSPGSSDPWTLHSTTFTYVAGEELYFMNLGGDNLGALLDNVQITREDPTSPPIPEPATMALLGMGLVCASVRKLRGRQR